MKTSVAWLSAEAAAIHLGYVDEDGSANLVAFYQWLSRERRRPGTRLRVYRLRGRLRFREVDLDRCVEAEPLAAPQRLRVVGGRQ